MERLQSVMIQFYLEKFYGFLFDGNENTTRSLHLEELFKYITVLLGAFQLSYILSVFVIPRWSQFLFSVLYHLSVINSMQMKFVDLESENICFPESLALRLLGNLAMFWTWWRNSCKLFLFRALNVTDLKPQSVKLIYIDKREQNWLQLKFLSAFCARNNEIFPWKAIPNSINIQSQYFFVLNYYFLAVFPVGKLYSRWKSKTCFKSIQRDKKKKKKS